MDMTKSSVTVIAMVAALAACEGEKRDAAQANAVPTPNPGGSRVLPPLAPKPVEAAKPPEKSITRGIAKFEGDALFACSLATLRHDARLKPTELLPFSVVLLAEDVMTVALSDKAGSLVASGKSEATTHFRSMFFERTADQEAELGADKRKQQQADRTKLKKFILDAQEKLKEQGDVIVDTCEFPNRTALGTCALDDSLEDFGWTVVVSHFDVKSTLDSDRAMKNCLTLGGKWAVATGGEVDRERRKQRSQQLDKHMERLDSLGRSIQ